MDDQTIELILQGCKLAESVQGNLPNMTNQPEILVSLCDEIIRVFNKVKEKMSKAQQPHASQQLEIAVGVQEWLRNNPMPAMDLLRAQQLLPADAKLKGVMGSGSGGGGGLEEMVIGQMSGGGGGKSSLGSGRGIETPAMEAASSRGGGASSSKRQRRRGGGDDRRVERVAAPQIGNTEIPPEDGYTWRKYGQKNILNSRFPRSYFRCTHQKMYQCPAKKQVQRLDNDPNVFEVTYQGDHTCHLSSTAPSVPPPPPQSSHAVTYTTVSMTQWLSMDINKPRDDYGLAVAGGGVVGSTSGAAAGPSTSQYGRTDVAGYPLPVADMADVMFNSAGSSSNNSMDLIFSSIDNKWPDSEDKKN